MELEKLLLMMMSLLKESVNAPARKREITHHSVSKMWVIYVQLKRQLERKSRKYWVRPIFQENERLSQGASANLISKMYLLDNASFVNYFRMSTEIFDKLFNLVGPRISKQHWVRIPIPARTRLEITLRYLATGDSMMSLSYSFRVSQNTISKILAETCEEIWNVLKDKVFLQPNEASWRKVANDFERIWNFPNCIGAIDGKHVVMQAPANSGSTFYNYKGTHSINLLAVADANYCFTIVNIGAGGRQSDSGVFTSSGIASLFETNSLEVPAPRRLDDSNTKYPYVLVGDEAFPLSGYMMRPYPRSGNLNMTKKIFNYRLSRARRVVESAFGILSVKWRIFRTNIIASTSTANKIIKAATALHNFIIKEELQLPAPQCRHYCMLSRQDRDHLHTNVFAENNNNHDIQNTVRLAVSIRDAYAHYFEHVNTLTWQWERVLNNDF